MSILGAAASTLGPMIMKEAAPRIWEKLTEGRSDAVKEVAEVVAAVASDTLGLSDDATKQDVQAAIEKNPEAYVKVQQFAHEQALKAIEAEMHYSSLEVQDRDSARQMYISQENNIQRLLVFGAFAIAFSALCLVGYMNVNGIDASDLLVTLTTGAIGALLSVFSFFFGSSLGSKRKDLKRDY